MARPHGENVLTPPACASARVWSRSWKSFRWPTVCVLCAFAETVIVVFDATIPFEKQDPSQSSISPSVKVARWCWPSTNGDLIEDRQAVLADLREKTERLLPQIRGIRAVTVSGQTGDGLDRLMQAVVETDKVWNKRIFDGQAQSLA